MNAHVATNPQGDNYEALIVRMIARSPRDRMQNGKPERYALECGFVRPTAPDVMHRGFVAEERGRMVCVLLEHELDIPEALHALADLWARQVRNDATLRRVGEGPVRFDIVDGGSGTITMHVEDLADWLHRMADQWGQRRAVRRALFRSHFVPGSLRVQ